MFQITKGSDGVMDTAKLRRAVNRTARNYLIQPNDYLNIQVFTNKGERLIDPNGELKYGVPSMGAGSGASSRAGSGGTGQSGGSSVGQGAGALPGATEYLVQADGTVKLPLLDDRVSVKGLSLIQADSVLQRHYNKYYKESFVKTAVTNNRVFVLGAPGGRVISLANDNMNLLEVLALAGGADGGASGGGGNNIGFARYGGRIDNIRIIRGDLKNPQVQFINLSTLEGMRRGNLQVEPNDIIYIQPVRRPFLEGLSDATPVFAVFSTLLSTLGFVFTVISLSKN